MKVERRVQKQPVLFPNDPAILGFWTMNRYQHEWDVYRARMRRRGAIVVAVFLGTIPFLLLVAFIDKKLFSSTSLVLPAFFVWGALYLFIALRPFVFVCPRCGKNFFTGGRLSGASELWKKPKTLFGLECVHCGLRKFADSDQNKELAFTLEERKPQGAISKPITGSLRIFLAGSAGILVALALSLIPAMRSPSVLQRTLAPVNHGLAGDLFRLQQVLTSPYVIFPWFAVMAYLAVSKREQPGSWFYAFVAGSSLPGIIFHSVLHWV